MNIYILAAALFVLAFILCFVIRSVYQTIIRAKAKRKRKDNMAYLVGSNPRDGRKLLYHTVGKRLSRLSWSLFITNNEIAQEGIKELAEIQGIDNSGHHVDTFMMARVRSDHKYKILLNFVASIRHQSVEFMYRGRSIVEMTKRKARSRMNRLVALCLRICYKKSHHEVEAILKFIQNTGGAQDNDGSSDRSIN